MSTSPIKGIYINQVAYVAVPLAYLAELLQAHQAPATLPAINDELALMANDLDSLQAGTLPPFVVYGSLAMSAFEQELAAERDMAEQICEGWRN